MVYTEPVVVSSKRLGRVQQEQHRQSTVVDRGKNCCAVVAGLIVFLLGFGGGRREGGSAIERALKMVSDESHGEISSTYESFEGVRGADGALVFWLRAGGVHTWCSLL